MCGAPPLILKHLISSVVSLAQLVSPSVALPAELVFADSSAYLSCKEVSYKKKNVYA